MINDNSVLERFIKENVSLDSQDEENSIEEIKFNFEIIKPDKEITDLSQLKEIIVRNFPSIWFETRVCLSACATLSLKNLNGCPSINLIGPPSGEKTTVLSFFYGQEQTYLSDDFTPRAFVSHSANVKKEDLTKVDLLPKLQNKILITPELAPLFESQKDKLVDSFAILTRVLDGEGLNRDSGAHGHRGYSGDFKFVWIGASTPLKSSVWNVMGKIGNRLFFLDVQDKNRNDKDYMEMFTGRPYEEKVKECRGAVRSFLDNIFKQNEIRSLKWDAPDDVFLLPEIIKYAKFLARLRTTLMTWKGDDGEYEYSFPLTEEPPRAINALYNLAKGHAIINGRKFLKKEDLDVVKAVCFSSMPHDRHEFLKLLDKHEGKLTSNQIQNELKCSNDTALRTMKFFEILGIVTVKDLETGTNFGRPISYIEIKPEFGELLTHTQALNDEINNKSQKNSLVEDIISRFNHISDKETLRKMVIDELNKNDMDKSQEKDPA